MMTASPLTDRPLRAAIYLRISSDREGEELGVSRQREDCQAKADQHGWTVAEHRLFVDNDRGASEYSRKKRKAYEAMLEAAERREFDVILAYSNSRLTRRSLEFHALIDLYRRTGIRLSTVVSGDDDLDTADGRFAAKVKADADAAEAERISERVRRSKLAHAAEGRPSGGQ